LKPPTKRLLAFAGSVVAGLFGAIVLASPAQAHHLEYSSSAVCQANGEYVITWTLHTDNWSNRYAKITELSVNPDTPINGIQEGSVIPPGGDITGKQRVPGTSDRAQLHVEARWYNTDDTDSSNTDEINVAATGLTGGCTPQPQCVSAANAQYKHTFNGPKGEATVELKGELPLCEGQKQDFLLVSYYAPGASFGTPQYAFDHAVGTVTDKDKKIELKVDIPPCWTQVDLVWGGESVLINPLTANGPRYGNAKLGSAGEPGNRSVGPNGWYNGPGTEGRACTTPKATFVSDCAGAVKVHLSNEGQYAATFTVKATNFEQNVSVPAGESKDVTLPKGAGKITVTEQGKEIGTYTWKLPEDCPPPTLVVESTCDTFTLKITNPQGGLPAEAKATYGTQSKTVTVAPGKTETIVFQASSTTTAKVTFTGLGLELVALYEKPANCGILPKTGPNTMTFVASGTGLAALGGVVFFFARRRMVKLRRLASY
jgi:LPXTG-motif cell wall-anchored protein